MTQSENIDIHHVWRGKRTKKLFVRVSTLIEGHNFFFRNIVACKLLYIRSHSWSGFQTKLWFCRKQDVANCIACVGTKASPRRGLGPHKWTREHSVSLFVAVMPLLPWCSAAQACSSDATEHSWRWVTLNVILRKVVTQKRKKKNNLALSFTNKRPKPSCLSFDSSAT